MEEITIYWHNDTEIEVEVDVRGTYGDLSVGLKDDFHLESVYSNGKLIENMKDDFRSDIIKTLEAK